MNVPQDYDQVFCSGLDYETKLALDEGGKMREKLTYLRICVTTKRLLSQALIKGNLIIYFILFYFF